jgi:ABC-type cobalamin/Fe3+-siderophores transport system ATPase subunit
MDLFRLRSLRVRGNRVFQEQTEFHFSAETDSYSIPFPYFTLILGPNGTGKSNVLKLILDIFRVAYNKKTNSKITTYPSGKYSLEYFHEDGNYTILNTLGWPSQDSYPSARRETDTEKGIRFFKDGTEIPAIDLPIPESILALSILLTDKFLFIKDAISFPSYKYFGVRRDNNTAGTKTLVAKIIDCTFLASSREEFLSNLKDILGFLDLENEFFVSYSPKYKSHLFKDDLTIEQFEQFFLNYQKILPRRTTEPWNVDVFKSLKRDNPEILPSLVDLLRYLSRHLQKINNSRSQYFAFDIFNQDEDFHRYFPLLPHLHRLNLISYPQISLRKSGQYQLDESSSGEYHFISTMLAILSAITPHSLILIDEPEVSLHPKWQMQYISFLNKIFKKYNSAHFIICSHSHFMVSDMSPENSTVLSLKRENAIVAKVEPITYGWSAEEILYSIFEVRSMRNSFLEYDLTKLVSLINKGSEEYDEIRRISNKMASLTLSENDPLLIIIEKAQKYLANRNA